MTEVHRSRSRIGVLVPLIDTTLKPALAGPKPVESSMAITTLYRERTIKMLGSRP